MNGSDILDVASISGLVQTLKTLLPMEGISDASRNRVLFLITLGAVILFRFIPDPMWVKMIQVTVAIYGNVGLGLQGLKEIGKSLTKTP